MTLQEIADYAMDYLDTKGVAAEYEIDDHSVNVHFKGSICFIHESATMEFIKAWLDELI